MPRFKLNENDGEGIEWSNAELFVHANIQSTVANEKLEIERETMEYLRNIVNPRDTSSGVIPNALLTDKVSSSIR